MKSLAEMTFFEADAFFWKADEQELKEIGFDSESRNQAECYEPFMKLWAAAKVKVCKAIVSVFHSEDCPFFSAPAAEIKEVGDAHYCNQDCRCPACQRTMHDFELTEQEVAHA